MLPNVSQMKKKLLSCSLHNFLLVFVKLRDQAPDYLPHSREFNHQFFALSRELEIKIAQVADPKKSSKGK